MSSISSKNGSSTSEKLETSSQTEKVSEKSSISQEIESAFPKKASIPKQSSKQSKNESEPVSEAIPAKAIEKMLKDFDKNTLSEYKIKQIEESPLFQNIYSSNQEKFKKESAASPSILVTGFTMRNLKSLQDALQIKEDERQR